jgi:DNA modification methylase
MTKESGPKVDLRCGDCLNVLPTLKSRSVNCCVTSSPYWGLRDYGHDDQLGLEKTPEEYVVKMVRVFREVRRVLRDDGTLWLNLGDSYNGSSGSGGKTEKQATNAGLFHSAGVRLADGLKPKDLVGIPWRVAFALQADGWYLRQDIIWHKPNPMPESVTDRCTKAHEYVFLLAKSQRYYYDAEVVKEPSVDPESLRGRNKRNDYKFVGQWGSDTRGGFSAIPEGKTYPTRNRRSVWTITPKPFKGAHFAVFPPDLAEPCVLAGCPAGGTVLDPFNGSGTCGVVAVKNGRNYVGIELNPEYAEMSRARIEYALRTTSEELFIGGGK